MRRFIVGSSCNAKENKYDQTANLAIDIETQLNKSVVLPKIASKMIDQQYRDFISKRKNQEDKTIQILRQEVGKLRKQVYRLQQKKINIEHIRTEENQSFPKHQNQTRHRPLASHHFDNSMLNLRASEFQQPARMQRNTEKSARIMRQDNSCQTMLCKMTEVELQKPLLKKVGKQQKESKTTLTDNRSTMLDNRSTIVDNRSTIVDNRSTIVDNRSTIVDKQKPKAKKKKQRNPKVARRLRKCILAVYFTIFFPSFARKIYINRLKSFISEYPHDVSKYYVDKKEEFPKIKQDQAQLWSELEGKLDIMKAIEQAKLTHIFKDDSDFKKVKVRFQIMLNQDLNTSQRSINQSQTIESQLFRPKTVEYLLAQFQKIATKLIQNFIELIKNSSIFIANWRSYAQGLLNNSFINNSHPKLLRKLVQSGMVRLSLFKEIIHVYDQDTEIMMVTFDLFCRIYCYNWFCKLKDNRDKYSQQKLALGNFFLTLLYIIGEMMLQQKIKSYLKAKIGFQDRHKKRNKKIRAILPLMIRRKLKNDLKELNRLIYDPPLWKEVSSLVLENKELVETVQNKMTEAGSQLHFKLSQLLKEDHRQFKQKTLEQKYIIRNDKERPENLQKYENLQSQKVAENRLSQVVQSQVVQSQVVQSKLSSNKKLKLCIKVNKQKDLQ